MTEKRFKRIERPATPEERERHATIRGTIVQEFPLAEGAGRPESPPGIPTRIRQARESREASVENSPGSGKMVAGL